MGNTPTMSALRFTSRLGARVRRAGRVPVCGREVAERENIRAAIVERLCDAGVLAGHSRAGRVIHRHRAGPPCWSGRTELGNGNHSRQGAGVGAGEGDAEGVQLPHGVLGEVAAGAGLPFVVLLDENHPSEAEQGRRVGEHADDVGSPLDFPVQSFDRIR